MHFCGYIQHFCGFRSCHLVCLCLVSSNGSRGERRRRYRRSRGDETPIGNAVLSGNGCKSAWGWLRLPPNKLCRNRPVCSKLCRPCLRTCDTGSRAGGSGELCVVPNSLGLAIAAPVLGAPEVLHVVLNDCLRPPRCVSTGPVVMRLEKAKECERESVVLNATNL